MRKRGEEKRKRGSGEKRQIKRGRGETRRKRKEVERSER